MKNILIALVVLILVWFGLKAYNAIPQRVEGSDYKTVTTYISGRPITLGSQGTQFFGNEVQADINGDGLTDVAFLITEQPGGSGTFFYLVGALKQRDGSYIGTQAMLIGDRIAPQTTEFKNGLVIINYADRGPTESMSTKPSYGKSLYAKYSASTNDFGEVVQNFEGESR
jgi:hypothetical protein